MTESEKFDLIISKLQKLDTIETDVKGLKTDVEDLKGSMKVVKEDIEGLKTNVEDLKGSMKVVKEDIEGLKTDVEDLKGSMKVVKEDIEGLKTDVKNTKLIVENEIRTNIQRIAEGHLDLSRNLHEAMKPSNEVEMLAIKVSVLESEVRELKRKIS